MGWKERQHLFQPSHKVMPLLNVPLAKEMLFHGEISFWAACQNYTLLQQSQNN